MSNYAILNQDYKGLISKLMEVLEENNQLRKEIEKKNELKNCYKFEFH